MKHHYVPAAYLRLFTDPTTPATYEPFVWVADMETQTLSRSAPHNLAEITDHNVLIGEDGLPNHSAEKMLAEIESAGLPLIKALVAGEGMPQGAALASLLAYVAIQFARTPSVRGNLEDWRLSGERKLLTMMACDREGYLELLRRADPELTEHQRESAYQFVSNPANYTLSVHSSRALMDALTVAGHMEPLLARMRWGVIRTDAGEYFTSDNPVSVVNPKAPNWNVGHGLGNVNSELTFPLSPTTCLFGAWSDVASDARATPEQVYAVNLRTVILADRECFASTEDLARKAVTMRLASRKIRTSD